MIVCAVIFHERGDCAGLGGVPKGANDGLTQFTSSILSSHQGCLGLALSLQRLIKFLQGHMCFLSGQEKGTTKVLDLLLYIM